jgi:hypothetical protein
MIQQTNKQTVAYISQRTLVLLLFMCYKLRIDIIELIGNVAPTYRNIVWLSSNAEFPSK